MHSSNAPSWLANIGVVIVHISRDNKLNPNETEENKKTISRLLMTAHMVAMKYHDQWKATSKVSIETHDTLKNVTHDTFDAESEE